MSPSRKISQETELLLVRLQVERSTEKDKKDTGGVVKLLSQRKRKNASQEKKKDDVS